MLYEKISKYQKPINIRRDKDIKHNKQRYQTQTYMIHAYKDH